MNNLFLTVVSLSLMGSFLILCVVLLNKMLRINYSRQWLYVIWAVIAIRLIVPVNICIIDIPEMLQSNEIMIAPSARAGNMEKNLNRIEPSNNLSVENNHMATEDKTDIEDDLNGSDTEIQEKLLVENNLTASGLFFYFVLDTIAVIWIVGVILFLLYHLGAYFNYRKKISRWSILVKNNEVLEQLHSLYTELNIKHQINVMICNQVQAPMLIGFIKPCIVLPSKTFTTEEYSFILKHELIHYKHHDLFYKLIMLCAAAVHWFNPFIHYMVYLANNDMELYCDEKLVSESNLHYRENYSKMLLQMITGAAKSNNLLLSTGFGSKSRQLKNRFFQIMNSKPTKKGTGFIWGFVCLTIVAGNLVAWFTPTKTSNAGMTDLQISPFYSASENKKFNTPELLEKISNVLVVGIDGASNNDNSRADSILVVSVNPDTKKIYLTSFLRDMYLQIPEHGKDKLSSVYHLGGTDLIKNTIEMNFDINIDHTVTVNMKAFENIINSIGGIEMELSKKEAEYLNKTNFISKKQYRSVIAGKQKLNGNQALGYIRVRMVPTIQGESGDFGRTGRLRSLLSTVIEQCSKKDIGELTMVITDVVSGVTTDLSPNQILVYLNTVLQSDFSTDTCLVPAEGSYTSTVQDGMSVLDVDLDENRKTLKYMQQ